MKISPRPLRLSLSILQPSARTVCLIAGRACEDKDALNKSPYTRQSAGENRQQQLTDCPLRVAKIEIVYAVPVQEESEQSRRELGFVALGWFERKNRSSGRLPVPPSPGVRSADRMTFRFPGAKPQRPQTMAPSISSLPQFLQNISVFLRLPGARLFRYHYSINPGGLSTVDCVLFSVMSFAFCGIGLTCRCGACVGGLRFWSPAAPAVSFLCCPYPPDPRSQSALPRRGRGRPRFISCKGLRPLHPQH